MIGIRLVHLQVLGREFFEQQGTRQSERTINLDPRRGPILDRDGRPLAVSVDAESLYAVPQDVVDPPADRRRARPRALGLDAAGRRELRGPARRRAAPSSGSSARSTPAPRAACATSQLDGDRLPHRAPPLLPAARARPRTCSATWASTTPA